MAQHVLSNDDKSNPVFKSIETVRKEALNNNQTVELNDLGAGSKVHNNRERSISQITKATAIPSKYGRLLYRLIKWGEVKNVLELGTGSGISSSYILSALGSEAKLYTIEGADALIPIARKHIEQIDSSAKIDFIAGNFDTKMESVLDQIGKLDLILLDGNHKKESTLRYFKQISPYLHPESIVILDDIRWTKDMLEAWHEIRNNDKVTCSIDLFRMGLLFFKRELLKPQHISYKY